MRIRNNLLFVIIFFLFLGGLWIYPAILSMDHVLFHPRAEYSDILISHWPNMQFVRDAWKTWGEFPLWNPLILSGAPLVGDPLFGIWYPPNWLALLLPVQLAFNILLWAHLAWAGIGMFQWMKSEGMGWGAALLAGIAFSGTPKLIGQIALGHLGLVSAVAWTPWLLFVIRRMIISIRSQEMRSLRWFCLGGAVTALIFLADLRWIVPACALAALYAVRTLWRDGINIPTLAVLAYKELLAGTLSFFGLISGLAFPLVEFTVRSTRTNLSFEEIAELSLPIDRILGLFIPTYEGWPETLTFVGLLIVGLAFIAILGRGKEWLFWTSVALGFLLVSFGNHTPLYKLLFRWFPGFGYLRVPARFFYLCSFSFAALAGIGFDLLSKERQSFQRMKQVRLGIVGFGGSILLLSIGAFIILQNGDGTVEFPWQHMVFAAILFLGLGFLTLRGVFNKKVAVSLWSAALILDLFLINQSLLEIRTMEEWATSRSVIQEISTSIPGIARTFSPSYSIPQDVAERANLQLADGVNPLQLNTYWVYMADAIGFNGEKYSVTLPPFPEGDMDQTRYTSLDTHALGLLNVTTLVSEYPLHNSGLKEKSTAEAKYIYQNSHSRPRAWVEGESEGEDQGWRDVESIKWSPNFISIEASGPGILVLSELDYPGWRVVVNGEEVSISAYNGLLRSVQLTEETNLVEFQYRPWTVIVGTLFTLFTAITLIVIWWRR